MTKLQIHKLRRAVGLAVHRPDYVRNRIYGVFNYWPVSAVETPELRLLPYFCISLRSAVRRRSLVLRQVERMGLENVRFVDAVVGADLRMADLEAEGLYDDAKTRELHGRSLTKQEIALSLSHIRVYERIVADQLPCAAILEDDVLFNVRNLNKLQLSHVPKSWEIFFLHAHLNEEPPRGPVSEYVYHDASYAASSAAYLVSLNGARKLLSASKPVVHGADGLLGRSLHWSEKEPHPFRQVGVDIQLEAYIMYPFGALNGSTCYFTQTTLPT